MLLPGGAGLAKDLPARTSKILPVSTGNGSTESAGGDVASSPIRAAVESIAHHYLVEIKPIFKQACFDCHTSLTEYPWYYSMPGVRSLIDNDIADGRNHLDFSNDYPFLSNGYLTDDLRAIARVMKDNSMPPLEYTLLHWSRSLQPEQKTKILAWVENSLALLGNAGYVAAAAD